MTQALGMLTNKQARDFIAKTEPAFESLPHLPKNITNFIVTITPWLALVGGLLSIYSGIAAIAFSGSSNQLLKFAQQFSNIPPAYFVVSGAITIITGLLLLVAFKPLRQKQLAGWIYIFWTQILSVLLSLVGIVMGVGGIFGAVLGALIGFYLIFEIKPSYK